MAITVCDQIRSKGKVEILCNENPLLQYNHIPPEWGHPHFHPVRSPAGHVLTNLAPHDHVWHCGLWFAWTSINGVNVWEQPASPSGESEIKAVSSSDMSMVDGQVRFSGSYHWQKRDGSLDLLDGGVEAMIHPPKEGSYCIDLNYTFRGCGGDTTLGRVPYHPQKCDWGGFAGMSFLPTRDFITPVVTNADGETEDIRWKRTRWLDMSGQLDGFRDAWAGICLMDHPKNIRHPVPANMHEPHWPLRWTQLALLYEDDYVLPEGVSLELRYRAVVHDGRGDVDRLNRIWEEWV